MNLSKNDYIYSCSRENGSGKFTLWISRVRDIEITHTTKGRPRKPIYVLEALNYKVGDKLETVIKTSDVRDYYKSAAEAVVSGFRRFFEDAKKDGPRNAEERLVSAIFGSELNPRFFVEQIPRVIEDLKDFHDLFSRAINIDGENLRGISQSDLH